MKHYSARKAHSRRNRGLIVVVTVLLIFALLYALSLLFVKSPQEQLSVSSGNVSTVQADSYANVFLRDSIELPSMPAAKGTEGAVFLGNSILEDLYISGLYPNADYFCRTGLNVRSVFDTPTSEGHVPIIEELDGHDYSDVFLMFGLNELGWPEKHIFSQEYYKVILSVKKKCPNADIYVLSVLPVSRSVSDKGENGVTMEAVTEMNCILTDTAAEAGALFLNLTSPLMDSEGYLPSEASYDGIHLNTGYLHKLADMLNNKEEYVV